MYSENNELCIVYNFLSLERECVAQMHQRLRQTLTKNTFRKVTACCSCNNFKEGTRGSAEKVTAPRYVK